MLRPKPILYRLVYGHRYDDVPWGQRIYIRPGERHIRALQWALRLRRAPVVSLDDYRAQIPLDEREEFLACTLCGETRQQPLCRPHGGTGRRAWEYRVVRCPRCGFLYRNPGIRPERLGDLYASGYSKFLTGDYAENRQRRYRMTMDACAPLFDDGEGRRLLDFGCGAGLFLELAESLGFECHGVDLSADSIESARARLSSAQVFTGSCEDVPEIAAGGFDLITMWSVLAHLPRPLDDLAMLRGLLAPGGVLLIFTVNARSLQLKARGDAWSGFTKNHLMFYSADTLPSLLERTGFAGVAFRPFYGDAVESGTAPLSPDRERRLRHAVATTDGGNMMRAVAFADAAAIARWGADLQVRRLGTDDRSAPVPTRPGAPGD